MRRLSLSLLIISSTSLLVACANEQNYAVAVRSWQGASERQLFNVWGYPDKIQRMSGRKLLVYRTVDKGSYPTYSTPGYTSVSTSGGATTVNTTSPTSGGGGDYDFRCTTWFEINKSGRIANTSFRGNGCVATDSFLRSRRNS
ncbi:MAG: hypothetical protein COB66_02175 [Coxiella sp. (in: Bacteria)]|nr:MAG: hypothetical protein COB66_02175 [Coxiella sp. (in: g-proteobacteria)]